MIEKWAQKKPVSAKEQEARLFFAGFDISSQWVASSPWAWNLLGSAGIRPTQILFEILPKSFQPSSRNIENPSIFGAPGEEIGPRIWHFSSPNPPLKGSWEGAAKCPRISSILVSIWEPPGLHFRSIFA